MGDGIKVGEGADLSGAIGEGVARAAVFLVRRPGEVAVNAGEDTMAVGCVVTGSAAAAEHEEDGAVAGKGCATVGEDNGAATAEDDESCGRTMRFDFVLAAAREGGGGAILVCKAGFEEGEAGRTVLLDIFLAAARAASLSLLLQVEHVLRGDHSPCLSLS